MGKSTFLLCALLLLTLAADARERPRVDANRQAALAGQRLDAGTSTPDRPIAGDRRGKKSARIDRKRPGTANPDAPRWCGDSKRCGTVYGIASGLLALAIGLLKFQAGLAALAGNAKSFVRFWSLVRQLIPWLSQR